jgi:hypothetical protein
MSKFGKHKKDVINLENNSNKLTIKLFLLKKTLLHGGGAVPYYEGLCLGNTTVSLILFLLYSKAYLWTLIM